MSVKITALEAENVKRIKAVALEPAESGLTVIGGRNGQGKTSVLDAIAWALGGDRKRPTEPKRKGAATDAHIRLALSNGIVVERHGKNGSLKVTDPEGRKGGQQLLNAFVEQLALDLPRFLNGSNREKADALLGLVGVGDELARLDEEEDRLSQQRLSVGQIARQKRGAADELPSYPDAPSEPVSAAELIEQQQAILARNGENQRKRQERDRIAAEYSALMDKVIRMEEELKRLNAELEAKHAELEVAYKTAEELADESTTEIEESIRSIDEVNAKVRANQAKAAAEADADDLEGQYKDLGNRIAEVRGRKTELLSGVEMPLEDLTVEHGELVYRGQRWDNMSGSEQLQVATAIVRALKPECGFVLVDKLEQMDTGTLAAFAKWCEGQGLQVIGTRVSTGDECSIVIEDGYVSGSGTAAEDPQVTIPDLPVDQETPKFNFPGKE